MDDDDYDFGWGYGCEDEDEYDSGGFCYECGGEGFIITCVDDLCHGAGYCMHGDGEDVCPVCHGGY